MTEPPSELSVAVTHLLKGVVYRDSQETVWKHVMALQSQISDYLSIIGLRVEVDEAEGFAYVRTREAEEDEAALPRLVARRTLSFHVSLLLALLRKKLAEFDATASDTRLVLSREQIVELMRVFVGDSQTETRLVDQIDSYINKVIELGFLRRLRNDQQQFEVRRILKAYVDGQWLSDFDARLQEYRTVLVEKAEAS